MRKVTQQVRGARNPVRMGSTVLSLRIDGELLDRLKVHAAKEE